MPDEPAPAPPPEEDLVFRRGKLRKRDDPALDLFQEALASLADPPRVKRILFELTRLYDPVTNGPILAPATQRRVLECLEAGREAEARQLLDDSLTRYRRPPGQRARS